MTDEQRRRALKLARPGILWAAKVDAMSDNQVWAVYNRFLKHNKL